MWPPLVYTSILPRALSQVNIKFFLNVKKNIKYIKNVLSVLSLTIIYDPSLLSLTVMQNPSTSNLAWVADPRNSGLVWFATLRRFNLDPCV
jgi:hypothetical protein